MIKYHLILNHYLLLLQLNLQVLVIDQVLSLKMIPMNLIHFTQINHLINLMLLLILLQTSQKDHLTIQVGNLINHHLLILLLQKDWIFHLIIHLMNHHHLLLLRPIMNLRINVVRTIREEYLNVLMIEG